MKGSMANRYHDNTTLIFTVKSPDSQDPVTYEYIEGGPTALPAVTGSLQPFRGKGLMQADELKGFTLEDMKMFITDAVLPYRDDLTSTVPATTQIGGRTYYIFRKFDYKTDGVQTTSRNWYVLKLQNTTEGSV